MGYGEITMLKDCAGWMQENPALCDVLYPKPIPRRPPPAPAAQRRERGREEEEDDEIVIVPMAKKPRIYEQARAFYDGIEQELNPGQKQELARFVMSCL
jgi:hypothetical protein